MPQDNIADQLLGYLQQEEPDYAAAAKLGDAAMPLLKDIIKGSDERLASKATSLIGMINSSQKGDALVEAAQHPSVVVRVAAAAAAANLQPDQATKVLNKLVDDADIGVSKYALRSIRAKNLAGSFRDKLQHLSANGASDAIRSMAKEVMANK